MTDYILREKLETSQFKYKYIDDWDGFVLINENKTSFDSEKGFVDVECVIKRLSDNKYFKFTYTKFGQGNSDILEQTATQVFHKTKIIDIYE